MSATISVSRGRPPASASSSTGACGSSAAMRARTAAAISSSRARSGSLGDSSLSAPASASTPASASATTSTSGAQFFAASVSSAFTAISAAGRGMRQFWVIIASRSLPTASTTSASSHSAPTSGTWTGPATAQGCSGGTIPRPWYVVTMGAPSSSASAAIAAPAPA